METSVSRRAEEIDLDDVVSRLLARRLVLLVAAIIGALVVYSASRFLPKTYESKATIFVQTTSGGLGLSRDASFILGTGSGRSGYLITLLQSETMRRAVASSLRLAHRKELGADGDIEKAVRFLRANVSSDEDRNGSIDVVAKAPTPFLAAAIANSFLENLGRLVKTSSKRKATFISERLEDTAGRLRKAEDELLSFQQHSDVASLEDETRGVITQLVDVADRLTALGMELEQVESELRNSGEPDRLVDLEVRKRSIEASRESLLDDQRRLRSKLSSLPATAMGYARLQRNVAVLSKTFDILTEQYQLATISQYGEDGDYQIVDHARPDRRPVGPKPVRNACIGGLLSLVVAGLIVAGRRPASRGGCSSGYRPAALSGRE